LILSRGEPQQLISLDTISGGSRSRRSVGAGVFFGHVQEFGWPQSLQRFEDRSREQRQAKCGVISPILAQRAERQRLRQRGCVLSLGKRLAEDPLAQRLPESADVLESSSASGANQDAGGESARRRAAGLPAPSRRRQHDRCGGRTSAPRRGRCPRREMQRGPRARAGSRCGRRVRRMGRPGSGAQSNRPSCALQIRDADQPRRAPVASRSCARTRTALHFPSRAATSARR